MTSIALNNTHEYFEKEGREKEREKEYKNKKIETDLILYRSRPYNKAVTHPLNRLTPNSVRFSSR